MEINRPEEQQKAAVGAALDAPRGGKTQLPKIRTAINAEQIAGTRLPPAARPRLTDGQRPPRREEQAPQETTTTTNMNINIPEEHQEAEYGREKVATDHHPAPPTADQSAMHHGKLPQELQPPPTTQLQVAHAPAAAAPQATEMDSDERLATGSRAAGDKRRSSPAPRAGSTGRSPSPHRDKRGKAPNPKLEARPRL
eukprot:jgi/Tetstr1/465239/TSEL_009942.t1